MNSLDQRLDTLAHTHHVPLLKAVLAALESYHPFAWHTTAGRLLRGVDNIAQRVLARTWRDTDLLTPAPQGSARRSTLHRAPEARDEVRPVLQQMQGRLAQHFGALASLQPLSVQDLARQRMGALQQVSPFGTLAQEIPDEVKRPFSARRQRLTFTKPAGGAAAHQPFPGKGPLPSTGRGPVVSWPKLTVTMQAPDDVIEQVAEAVRLHLEQGAEPADSDDLHERINEQVASPTAELARLVRLIATETVGQVKKGACLCSLAFLEEQMDERNRMRPALRELLRRLRLLQGYVRRDDKADAAYEVTYQGQTMNLRSVVAQAAAFSDVPVFPLVDGSLGEITNQGTHTYVFGMKLKLNGKVARYGNLPSFEYHLALLRKDRPARPEHLVRLAVLHHRMFSRFGDSTYDPIAALEQEVLPLLQGDTASPDGQAAVERLFAAIFYLSDRVVIHPDRRERSLREGLMSLLTMLSLLKMCVMTRIAGAVPLRDRLVSLIPIGGKSVSGAGQAYHHDVASFERALHRQMRGAHSNDWALKALHPAISRLMDHAEILLPPESGSYLSLYQDVSEERLEQWLCSDELVEDAYVLGNLLLVPVDAAVETTHHLGISREIAAVANEHTRRALTHLLIHPREYSQSVVDGAKAFCHLLKEVEDAERSQRLEHRGGIQRGYYVVPLAMFVAKGPIATYCQELAEREEDELAAALLRSALIHYVRDSYPIDTLLPIGSWYSRFPFLLITSQDLQALRAKTFQTGHTLMSREVNLLTLLLSDEGQGS